MRNIRQFCAAAFLTSAIAFSVYAGDMGCPGVTAPSDAPPPTETVAGDMQTPGVTADPVMEIALDLLLNVSSLL